MNSIGLATELPRIVLYVVQKHTGTKLNKHQFCTLGFTHAYLNIRLY